MKRLKNQVFEIMIHSLRKINLAITFVIASTSSLHGSNSAPSTTCPELCCHCECGEFFIGADVLVFRGFVGGLSSICDSVNIVDTTVDGVTISTLKSDAHDPNFNWNAGVRVGVGYEFVNCGALGIFWTHFNSHTNRNKNSNHVQWKLNFDVVDVIYGQEYQFSNCFILSPFGGVRYANIDQKLTTNFLTNDNNTLLTSSGIIKEDFFGVGPLFGLDGDWTFGSGFSFYVDVALSLLYGSFNVTSDQHAFFTDLTNIDHTREHLQAYQTVLDTGFGIRWRTCVCDTPILVQLGIEQHRFFNQNQFCGYGDLSLDGVSLGLGLAF